MKLDDIVCDLERSLIFSHGFSVSNPIWNHLNLFIKTSEYPNLEFLFNPLRGYSIFKLDRSYIIEIRFQQLAGESLSKIEIVNLFVNKIEGDPSLFLVKLKIAEWLYEQTRT